MTPTFRKLLVEYSARLTTAESFEDLLQRFGPLAAKLSLSVETIQAVVDQLTEDERRKLWQEIVEERIQQAIQAPAFQAQLWERVSGRAAAMLERLLEKNLIKDPGELLAVAKAANQLAPSLASVNGGGNRNQLPPGNSGSAASAFTINVNNGGDASRQHSEEAQMTYDEDGRPILPAGGERIVIDLAPRMAGRMTQQREIAPKGARVIDSERLDAEALRTANPVESTNPADSQRTRSDPDNLSDQTLRDKQSNQTYQDESTPFGEIEVPDFMSMETQDGR
jgi:hypothetical protein